VHAVDIPLHGELQVVLRLLPLSRIVLSHIYTGQRHESSHVLETRLKGASRDVIRGKAARAICESVMQALRVRGIDDGRRLDLVRGHDAVRGIL
jgi:hypothetical protein